MKTGTVIAVVGGAVVLLFWAASRGLINAGVRVNPSGTVTGIVAPQPSQNYSGYLAASTAPAVTGAINTALSGLSSSLSAWLHPTGSPSVPPAQGATTSSPSLAAQPSGPTTDQGVVASGAFVGPQVPPDLSYNATPGSAFDYSGLALDNSFDPEASLEPQYV